MNIIGKKIRLLRHQNGWTQEDAAERLGLSVPAFSKMETGKSEITLSRLEQLARLFNLSVVQMMMVDEDAPPKLICEIATVNRRLNERGAELIDLQKKVIELYEELRMKAVG